MTKRKPGKRTKSGRLSRAVAAQAERTQTQTKAARDETLSTPIEARERLLKSGITCPEGTTFAEFSKTAEFAAMWERIKPFAKDPMAGCTAGRAIIHNAKTAEERADLWNAVGHMRKVCKVYDQIYGLNRHAQVARILVPVSAMEADASSPAFDDRDDETKQRQAVAAWMQVQGWLGCIDSAAAQECKAVVIGLPEDATARRPALMLAGLAAIVRGLKG